MTHKLSTLTPTDKTKMLAELRGITCKPAEHWGVALFSANNLSIGTAWSEEKYAWGEYCENCKDLISYDAIIPLVQKQDDDVCEEMENYLLDLFPTISLWQATPTQLCDALLVATGKAEV